MGRPAPHYWWDFSRPGELPVKVQSNYGAFPDPIATFDGGGDTEVAIEQAEQLISDMRAGRKNPRNPFEQGECR